MFKLPRRWLRSTKCCSRYKEAAKAKGEQVKHMALCPDVSEETCLLHKKADGCLNTDLMKSVNVLRYSPPQ